MDSTPTDQEGRLRTACLLAITFILTAVALHWLREVLVPLVLAAFIAVAVSPLMDLQTRYLKAPRSILFSKLDATAPLANILAGRPASG